MWKIYGIGLLCVILVSQGCVGVRTNRHKSRQADRKIGNLTAEVENLNTELLRIRQEKEVEMQRLRKAQKELLVALRKEVELKNADVSMGEKGIMVTFLTEIFFDSGKAILKSSGRKVLKKIIEPLTRVERNIRIEGHTDNVPIRRSKHLYASNWDLSAARAMSVLHMLEKYGIPSTRLSAAGFGEYQPRVPNDSDANRARNRRVEIVILPDIKLVDKVS